MKLKYCLEDMPPKAFYDTDLVIDLWREAKNLYKALEEVKHYVSQSKELGFDPYDRDILNIIDRQLKD